MCYRIIRNGIVAILSFLLLTIQVRAGPMSLANEPILDAANVPPNIMLLIDSSGSMFNNTVPNTGGKTRIEVAREAAIELIDSLENVRIGLAIFEPASFFRPMSDGANILIGIDDIQSNKNAVISRINNIPNTGWTPLAEALHQIGRYFVQDHNNMLTMYPDQANEETRSAYTIFNVQPDYRSGVVQSSPIQYFCQKSFVLLLTDGEPTQDRDISASTGLQDYDLDCQNRQPPCDTYDRKPAGSGYTYSTNGSDYIDDVAKAMFDIDLRPDLNAPAGVAKKNNVATYPIGFADPALKDNPLMSDIASGAGGEYLFADDASSLVAAFTSAAAAILEHISTATSVAFSTVSLTTDSAVYLSQYNTVNWSGNLVKVNLDDEGELSGTAWEAASKLDATTPSTRVILTYNRDTKTAIPFKTLTDLSTAQQDDLKVGVSNTVAQARIDYLRGDRSNEETLFRERSSVLGDIINSAPVFVGEPISNWPDLAPFPTGTSKYSNFKAANKNRTTMVYVGANDGMLHGFNATSGNEAIAYIPTAVSSTAGNAGLHFLTDPIYEHRFYVDLTPVVSDAYIKVTPAGAVEWRTVLIGGLRNGGNGYFALDVTDPGQFSEANANRLLLWEFTSEDDNRLGRTYSEPVIGLMNNGRWAAIFGNGYNATGTNKAALFIVFLDGGLDGVWTEGSDYFVFSTLDGNLPHPNGMASPAAVDLDSNGTIDRIYAGDLAANMWAFDVSSSNTSNWDITYGQSNNPIPLASVATQQSITTKPTVIKNPEVGDDASNQPNTIVLFGTGQLLEADDKINTDTQTFYGIWDHGEPNIGRSKLVEQTYSITNGARIVSSNGVDYQAVDTGDSDDGWYIDFSSGERIITDAAVRGDVVFFNTVIPNVSGPCSFGGTGWLMVVDAATGSEPEAVIFDVQNDDKLDDNDKINDHFVSGLEYETGVPAESSFMGDIMYTATSSGEIDKRKVLGVGIKKGRISWTQINRN